MRNCQGYFGHTRRARNGDKLKVSTGSHRDHDGEVTILVSTSDDRVGDARENICIHKHQIDLRLNQALQQKFGLEDYEVVRCTGDGHEQMDRKFNEDGFIINGHVINGKPAFITLDDILNFGSDETTIQVLNPRIKAVSTFEAHPKKVVQANVENVDVVVNTVHEDHPELAYA